MKIETIYNVQDTIFYIENAAVIEASIESISITVTGDEVKTSYSTKFHKAVPEEIVSTSREALSERLLSTAQSEYDTKVKTIKILFSK